MLQLELWDTSPSAFMFSTKTSSIKKVLFCQKIVRFFGSFFILKNSHRKGCLDMHRFEIFWQHVSQKYKNVGVNMS